MAISLENTLIGVAGEYLVAGELSLRGYLASITLRNSRGIDIIASNADASKSVSIQVKTNSNGSAIWLLNKKAEQFYSNDHYYVFVALEKIGKRPRYHIVPSKVVAEYTSSSHRNWLAGSKRDGSPRKDSSMRKFIDNENIYLERWDLISLENANRVTGGL